MIVNIDRHVFLDIANVRKKKQELRKNFERVREHFNIKLNSYKEKISELDGQEEAHLQYLVSGIKKVDTGKGKETKNGRKLSNEMSN